MPYQISWYIEQHVMLIEVTGTMDIEEFERLHTESFAYVTNSPFKTHAIVDLSQFAAIPTNLKMLTSATNKEKTDKQGMTVLVMPGMPSMIRFLVSIIMQTMRLEYRICETIDEAMDVLRRVDVSLRDAPLPSS